MRACRTSHPGGIVARGEQNNQILIWVQLEAVELEGLGVRFALTDYKGATFAVRYEGILPGLFREGQGILVTGVLDEGGTFQAEEVLAKHDENYMPPELAEMVDES